MTLFFRNLIILLLFFPVLVIRSLSFLIFLRAPRFKGYQQQDSQELLHYLMDSIRVEEIKVSLLGVPRGG